MIIEQPNIINQCNMSIGGVMPVDQNILPNIINLRKRKWWWPLFRFVIDVAVDNSYQMYLQIHLNPGKYRLDALGFRRAIVDAYYRMYKKSLPSATLQTICCFTVSITGLSRAHSDGVAYQDVKEPRYVIAKNAMLVFMLNVLNYITVRRAVYKVLLR